MSRARAGRVAVPVIVRYRSREKGKPVQVVIQPDAEAIASLVADEIERLLAEKPDAVLGLATGSSPLAIYDELVRRHESGRITFARARAFMLDEYVGLPEDHPERYRNVIEREIAGRVDFAPGAVQGPDGNAEDIPAACAAYEAAIADAGGVDLQILGIGTDGHIAFNEPGSSLASRTRIKTLTSQTRRDNARFFGGDVEAVPRHCVTQGLATIMSARHLVLVATGSGKAEAVHHLVEGAVSAMWPATVMQHHPRATVLVDPAAASRLQLGDYYREVFEHRPAWQKL
jgi:glucosamine-6-phosphate deaminase